MESYRRGMISRRTIEGELSAPPPNPKEQKSGEVQDEEEAPSPPG